MTNSAEKQHKCRLCDSYYPDSDMSEEHYPARNTGNDDIVGLNPGEIFDMFTSEKEKLRREIEEGLSSGQTWEDIAGHILDTRLAKPLFPNGRTARTLCRNCNTFLGKYDEAYLKFFAADGDPKVVNGFQKHTKYQIIKAIYAKFLSVPEAQNEKFDFIDFIRDEKSSTYDGDWGLYFVKRDRTTDLMGLQDIETGKISINDGVVYEMSDDKFIFNLMNFPKDSHFEMTCLFDILNKNYKLIEGVGEDGGYHALILMNRFSKMDEKLSCS